MAPTPEPEFSGLVTKQPALFKGVRRFRRVKMVPLGETPGCRREFSVLTLAVRLSLRTGVTRRCLVMGRGKWRQCKDHLPNKGLMRL